MAQDKDFHDYILHDIFGDFPGITSRAMFGGYGFYRYGKIFGIIADGKLYFKVGDNNRADFEEWASRPFVYSAKGRDTTMSYWEVPEEILENKDEIEEWIGKALEVVKR